MAITVKYFASFRETLGRSEDRIEAVGIHSVKDVLEKTAGDKLDDVAGKVLCAVNCEYTSYDAPVADGDEVAFFPPVTGG